MSLEVDGIWKTGVWNTTLWAAGVWREGAAPTSSPNSPASLGMGMGRMGRLGVVSSYLLIAILV